MFIDIREKEKKRGVRGLVTVPTNSKYDNLLSAAAAAAAANETSDTTAGAGAARDEHINSGPIKAEDLLELQEKITKEILSSKLQESDMQELQVRRLVLVA